MNNVKSVISAHNKRIMRKCTEESQKNAKTCNCRKPEECPTSNNCLKNEVVYKAEVVTPENNEKMVYVGMTANTFKERYKNHKKSLNDAKYKNNTELSKYVWKLKHSKKVFNIKWSILSQAHSIKPGGKYCGLCT